eukprot:gene3036-3861_t
MTNVLFAVFDCVSKLQRVGMVGATPLPGAGSHDSPLTVFTSSDCLGHHILGHPESPQRLQQLLNTSVTTSRELGFPVHHSMARATKDNLERVHDRKYVERMYHLFQEMQERASPLPLDGDTTLSQGTEVAALRAAGIVVQAVDAVLGRAPLPEGQTAPRRAFAMVRPPGHHAEPDKAMGFCIFNNVMVGCAHAQSPLHGMAHTTAARVAVLDFDVHHGNGDQAMCWDHRDRFYASTHQAPLFPGTGAATETGAYDNVVNVPLVHGAGSQEFRAAWRDVILPRVTAFAPDLVMISAGFDGHWRDPLANLALDEADFYWVTKEIVQVAETVSAGRVVSVLEGGYDIEALGEMDNYY